MGGNNALIIDEATDIDAVVNLAIQSALFLRDNVVPVHAVLSLNRVPMGMPSFNVLLKSLKLGGWCLEC